MHSYEALLSTHLKIILPTVLWRHIRIKTPHLYSFFSMFNAVLVGVDYFQDIYYRILFPLTINILIDDKN